MKFISWNVNGFRACLDKGFDSFFKNQDADFFCLQETKCQPEQVNYSPDNYFNVFHSAFRKGYSGTAVYAKRKPIEVRYGIHGNHLDEGRVITLHYPEFYLVNCYVPNSKQELVRIDYRMEFEDAIRSYLSELDKELPVIYTGDLNVAHEEIDLKNPGPNRGAAGFSLQEREKMSKLLSAGFTDSFRYLYPDKTGAYSWWSFRFNARANNAGWRIDYFIVSDRIKDKIRDSLIYDRVFGSDHCPIGLEIDL